MSDSLLYAISGVAHDDNIIDRLKKSDERLNGVLQKTADEYKKNKGKMTPEQAVQFDNQKTIDEIYGGYDTTFLDEKPADAILDEGGGVKYIKERNTGIAYFDKKKDWGLLDAYFARKLGLDPKWHYRAIDLNANVKQRNLNATKAYNDATNLELQAEQIFKNGLALLMINEKDGKSWLNPTAKVASDITGGFVNVQNAQQAEHLRQEVLSADRGVNKIITGTSRNLKIDADLEQKRLPRAASIEDKKFVIYNMFDKATTAYEAKIKNLENVGGFNSELYQQNRRKLENMKQARDTFAKIDPKDLYDGKPEALAIYQKAAMTFRGARYIGD